jgi:hypothetical protein
MWILKDILIVVGLVIMAIISVVNTIGTVFDIQQIRNEIVYWGLSWFELLSFAFMVAFLIVVIRLILRLNKYEKAKPFLNTRLLPFPLNGYRIVKPTEKFPFEPRIGYAKIGVKNTGGLLEDCIGTVTGISNIDTKNGRVTPLIFTSSNLFWDNGEISRIIPNDGVELYLNLAYLDQNKPDAWKLAIDESKREDYFKGWHKIDVVISSLKTQLEPVKIEIALGYGGREDSPVPLNPQPWDKWYQALQKKLQ